MKKLIYPAVGLLLIAVCVISISYLDCIKVNVINNSDSVVDFLTVECGTEDIEITNLKPHTMVSSHIYNFCGQTTSCVIEHNNKNSITGSKKCGFMNADRISAINIIIKNFPPDNTLKAVPHDSLKVSIEPVIK